MSDALLDVPIAEPKQDDKDVWIVAWAVVLLLMNGNANRSLSPSQRRRARSLLRIKFEMDALRYAERIAAGSISPDEWREGVRAIMTGYARQMAVAGAGTMPALPVQQAIAAKLEEQEPYLARFGALVGTLSVAAIAARTRLYGGTGWGAGDGVVEQWISRDDRATCRVCAPRHGQYYLPGQGPMPGLDCLGGGACRCERRPEQNLEMYAQLGGRA